MKHDMQFEENLTPGQRVMVAKGKHASSIGIIKEVIVSYHTKIYFIGTQKTIPAAHLSTENLDVIEITPLFTEDKERDI